MCTTTLEATITNGVGVATLVNSFMDTPLEQEKYSEYFFASPASLFQICERLKKLPTNNAQAIARKWEDALDLLNDVISEIDELQEDNGLFDFDETIFERDLMEDKEGVLSDEERAMMKRCLAMIKVTRILFRKVLVRCVKVCDPTTVELVDWLDELFFASQRVLAQVDDLAITLHGPQNAQMISLFASELTQASLALLELAQVHASDEHLPWFERCSEQFHRILISIHERNPQR